MPRAVRVKVCGLKTLADVKAAEGADAVGFVVASPTSRRNLAPAQAAALVPRVPPFVQRVMVTRETHPAKLAALQGILGTEAVQVHQVRAARQAREVRRALPHVQLLFALGVGSDTAEVARAVAPHADAILLDSSSATGVTGGTGKTHDWHLSARIARGVDVPVILAGGLTAANVGEAIRTVKPYAVDVSGGVEGPRGKSRARVRAFLREVAKA